MLNDCFFFEQLLEKRLEELIPQFDPIHFDRKLYETCKQDCIYYFMVKKRIGEEEFREYFFFDLANRGMEVKEELDAWISIWYARYKKRVKLLLGDEEIYNKGIDQLQMLQRRGEKHIPFELLKELKIPIIETLINNGEIVCTDTVAEQYIKTCMAERNKPLTTLEEQLNFINKVMNYASIRCKLNGYLVYLKIGTLLHHKYKWQKDNKDVNT